MEAGTYAFISYSTQNQSHADAVRRIFTEQGIPNWMAPYDIPSGSKYAAELNKALKNCGCLVLLLSDASQNSEHVDKEVERAIAYKKPIVPIQIEELILNDSFEYYIGNCQIIAVPELRMDSGELQRVLDGVRSFVGAAPAPVAAKPVTVPAPQPAVSQEALKQMFRKGFSLVANKNLTEGYMLLHKAAELGYVEAQWELGSLLLCGIFGLPKDEFEAFKWFQKGAEQGHASSQCSLGLCYRNGLGVTRDEIEAIKWTRKAVEQDDAVAQFHLGVCYEEGCGVKADPEEAWKWYRKAAENGSMQAKHKMRCK